MRQSRIIILIIIFCMLFLVPVFSENDFLESGLNNQLKEKREEIRNLFSDISLVNLLNGLYLTEKQMTEILQLARKARQIKQDFLEIKGTAYMRILDKAERAYQDLFSEIIKGEPAKQDSPI